MFLSDWEEYVIEHGTPIPSPESKPPRSYNADPNVTDGLTTSNTISTSVNNKIHPSSKQNSKLLIALVLILGFAVIGLLIIILYLWNRQIKKKRQLFYSSEKYQEECTHRCENREMSTESGRNTTEEETLLYESKLQEEEGRSGGTVPCDILQVNNETHVQSSENLRAPRAEERSGPVEQADRGIKST